MHGLGLKQRADRPQRIPQVTVAPAVDERDAGLRPVKAQDEAHGGGLARAVGPEEPRYPARLDREGQVIHRRLVPVELGQIARLNHALLLTASLRAPSTDTNGTRSDYARPDAGWGRRP
jgi:hypothetical protein